MKKNLFLCGLISMFIGILPLAAGAVEIGQIDTHGFASQGYLKSSDNTYLTDTEDGSFEFTEIGINFSTRIDKLRVGAQLLARDLGDSGNNAVSMDWAIGDYQFNENFGFKAGKIKLPSGLYNQERDIDLLRVSILLPSSVYDEGTRSIINSYQGAGIHGLLGSDAVGDFDYEVYYGAISMDKSSAYVKGQVSTLETSMPFTDVSVSDFDIRINNVKGSALRWTTPLDGLRLGATYAFMDIYAKASLSSMQLSYLLSMYNPTFNGKVTYSGEGDVTAGVASLEYTWNNLVLVGEYMQQDIELTGGIAALGAPETIIQKAEGWYAMATYDLSDLFSAGMYYSEFYPDRRDKDGQAQMAMGNPDYAAWQKETVPSLRFNIGSGWVLKAEVHFVDGVAQVYGYNNPGGREKDWTLYALKTTFSF